ncbi:MAG: hypothetical protein ACRCV5_09425, partial [Afipia sp.]
SAFVVDIPPLRERREDIALLARQFLERRTFQRGIDKQFTPAALAVLEAYEWPGNVRELGNVVERAIIMSHGSAGIGPEHLNLPGPKPDDARSGQIDLSFGKPPNLDQLRDTYLDFLLERYEGNRRLVAQVAGVSERNLYRLLKKGHLDGGK